MDKEQSSNKKLEHPKYYHEHLIQYGLLVVVFVFSIFLLLQLKSFLPRLVTIFILSLIYFGWGIWHHYEEKNLSRSHLLEYLAISALIFAVLAFVFLNR